MLGIHKLVVYQRALCLYQLIHEATREPPRGYGSLIDQIRRSTESVLSNIGEGAGRFRSAEKAHFYSIARGSAVEAVTQVDMLKAIGCIDQAQHACAVDLIRQIVSMLTKLYRKH